MPDLINKATGKRTYVAVEDLDAAVASGNYDIPGDQQVTIRQGGLTTSVGLSSARSDQIETGLQREDRRVAEKFEEDFGGTGGAITAGALGVARGVTLGASDLAANALGVEDSVRGYQEAHPGISIATEIGGAVIPGLFSGGAATAGTAARAGASLTRRMIAAAPSALLDRAGIGAARIAGGGLRGAAARGVTEGVVGGLATGVSQLALSEDPVDMERAVSVLSSQALFGGALGGGVSLVASAAGKGIARARILAEDAGAKLGRGDVGIVSDLYALDRKGLRAARDATISSLRKEREASVVSLKQDHAAEIVSLRDASVVDRAAAADEVVAYYRRSKEAYPWLATKGTTDRVLKQVWSVNERASNSLRRLTDNTKKLSRNPSLSLDALEMQEQALTALASKHDTLMAQITKEGRQTGERATRLELIPELLASNRALQQRIAVVSDSFRSPTSTRLTDLTDAIDAAKTSTLSSQRLQDISDAIDTVGERGKQGMIARSIETGLTGLGAGLLAPVTGYAGAAMIAAKGAEAISDFVAQRLGRATAESGARISSAVGRFVEVGSRIASNAPPIAIKTLTRVAFSPDAPEQRGSESAPKAPSDTPLVAAYRAREREILSQTRPGASGPEMRPTARQDLAARLGGVRAMSPIAADRMETIAARRLEFLAKKLPMRPEIANIGRTMSPFDRWRPSNFEIAQFARYVAAVEDPAAIVERLVDGSITPEDAEALRSVYPEIFSAIQMQIVESLPRLRATLPYARRLALSIFGGVPVDPALHPDVIAVLQANFALEAGTEGGTQAPRPQPAFGSISKQEPTQAQARAE